MGWVELGGGGGGGGGGAEELGAAVLGVHKKGVGCGGRGGSWRGGGGGEE